MPSNKLYILDIGSATFDRPAELFPDIERDVVRLDIDPENKPDIVHDIRDPLPKKLRGKFDKVIASHVLEHISWRDVLAALRNLTDALAKDGELWVMVPDLEECAKSILRSQMDLGFMTTLYGGQVDPYDNHLCGFTRDTLLIAFERCNLKTLQCYRTGISIVVNGQPFISTQIVCIGKKKW